MYLKREREREREREEKKGSKNLYLSLLGIFLSGSFFHSAQHETINHNNTYFKESSVFWDLAPCSLMEVK
jgi:hypothetical protein